MNVAVVGCGLIGFKRAKALTENDELIACCDTDFQRAETMANEFGCLAFEDYKELFNEEKIDIVIVSVVNKFINEIASYSLNKGKHVVAEKPLGRNCREAKRMVDLAIKKNLCLKTGFNHRFHPAIWKAKKLIEDGKIGPLFNIRARYGHGGRPGMEKEWRASKEICGGGELLDQGVHIIDLCRWFAGDIIEVFGKVKTKFWDMDVEDNSYVYMNTEKNVDIQFQVSWTNWKNIFSFEIFGRDGYLRIEGLGGSYGTESLEIGLRKKEGGAPDVEMKLFDGADISWGKEWQEFVSAIIENRAPIGDGYDGMKANKVVEAIYKSNKLNQVIKID